MPIVVEKTDSYASCSQEIKDIAEKYFLGRKFESLRDLTGKKYNGRLIFGNYLFIGDGKIEEQVGNLPSRIEGIVNEIPLPLKSDVKIIPLIAKYEK